MVFVREAKLVIGGAKPLGDLSPIGIPPENKHEHA
jgi:hypothetical protein